MSDSVDDRVHEATPTRRQQARSDGDVARSFELAAAFQMIGALAAAYVLLKPIGHWLQSWTTQTWSEAGQQLSVESADITGQFQNAIFSSLSVLAPLFLLLFLVGIGAHWLQTGPMFISKKIAPDPKRMLSGNWRQHVFSLNSLAFLVVGIPKTLIACLTLVSSGYYRRNQFFELANFATDEMVGKLFSLVLTITFHVALALTAVSILDYWMKRMSFEKRIKMSDQQLRDELRLQNGDPQTRARQRRMHRVG